jgi:hypothetical protein
LLLAQKELAQTVVSAKAAASTASSGSTAPTASSTSNTPAAGAAAAVAAAAPAAPASAPTAQSVFGSNPWVTDPTGSGPTGSFGYNPYYFATAQTAAAVAGMVGGTVVPADSFAAPGTAAFTQDEPDEMVQLSNGSLINPGLVASFYTHGYPQSMVDQMIANEVTNVSKGT